MYVERCVRGAEEAGICLSGTKAFGAVSGGKAWKRFEKAIAKKSCKKN